MKRVIAAVAVAVVLAFIGPQKSSAAPLTEVTAKDEPVSFASEAAAQEEISAELLEVLWGEMQLNHRQKREVRCIPYCIPKDGGVFCGVTCTF